MLFRSVFSYGSKIKFYNFYLLTTFADLQLHVCNISKIQFCIKWQNVGKPMLLDVLASIHAMVGSMCVVEAREIQWLAMVGFS